MGPSVTQEKADTKRMRHFMEQAFPLCRSITGNGVRHTLELIAEQLGDVELQRFEVPTGTPVLDWTVPNEWNLVRATLDGPNGPVLDSNDSNLHVVSYSMPVDRTMDLEELRPHLYSLPDQPTAIPYRTSYYRETWGFCLTHEQLEQLEPGDYQVKIDSRLEPGHLTYGEVVLPGVSADELLFTTHICHPSMANDNLSGIAALTEIARLLHTAPGAAERHHTIRILFIPGTIGSITWLARNQENLGKIKAGLVLAGAGDPSPPTFKRSRRSTTRIDLLMERLVAEDGGEIIDYYPYGYDERQFCSPGFDMAVGRLSRSIHGTYPEYHTSLDNLDFICDDTLADTVGLVLRAIDALEHEPRYENQVPHGEPQLGRRGLYGAVGGAVNAQSVEMALLWLLSYSDGEYSLVDIARHSKVAIDSLQVAATALVDAVLLKAV